MTRPLMLTIVLVVCLVAAAAAQDVGFAIDNQMDLLRVDFTNLTVTTVGTTGVFLESIATAPGGQLYGADTGGAIYSIDPETGVATLIGASGLGNVEGLDFTGDMLVAVNFTTVPSAYQIDLSDGSATLLATSDVETGSVRSASFYDADTLYLRGDAGGNSLFAMDINTGVTTLIGTQDFTVYGQDFINGTYYGLGNAGQLFTIDVGTGALTLLGSVGNYFFLGLTETEGTVSTEARSLSEVKDLFR